MAAPRDFDEDFAAFAKALGCKIYPWQREFIRLISEEKLSSKAAQRRVVLDYGPPVRLLPPPDYSKGR